MEQRAALLWTPASSDADLIFGVRSGHVAAFAVLFERHAPAARKVASRYCPSPADVDDVVAESFARVLRALQLGDGPELAFRAYLFTVVRRTGLDLIERGRRVQPHDDLTAWEAELGTPATSEDHALAQLENGIVADAFKSLPDRWQAVLWYSEVENLTPKDMAPLLGLSANGAAALAYRAREALRQAYLQQHLGGTAAAECLAANAELGAYVRGGLSARATASVESHLENCESCAALVVELNDVNHGMRSVIGPLVLGAFAASLLEQGLEIGSGSAALGAAAGSLWEGVAGGHLGHGSWAVPVATGAVGAGVVGAVTAAFVGAAGSGVPNPVAGAAAQGFAAGTTGMTGATEAVAPAAQGVAGASAAGTGVSGSVASGFGAASLTGAGAGAGIAWSSLLGSAGSILIPTAAALGVAALVFTGASLLSDPSPSPTAITSPSASAEQGIDTGIPDDDGPAEPSAAPSPVPPIAVNAGAQDGDASGEEVPGSANPPGPKPAPQETPSPAPSPAPSAAPSAAPSPSPSPSPTPDPDHGAPVLSIVPAPLGVLEVPRDAPRMAFTVENTGDADAEHLVAVLTLPAGLTFAGAAAAPWTCEISDIEAVATCALDELGGGQSSTLGLDLVIGAPLDGAAQTTLSVSAGDVTSSYEALTVVSAQQDSLGGVFEATGHLAATHVGATLFACDTMVTGCAETMAAVADSGSSGNNNAWLMRALSGSQGQRVEAGTHLSIPDGAQITYALLTWSANSHPSDTMEGATDQAVFTTPEGESIAIVANEVTTTTDPGGRPTYLASLDVTNLMSGSGEYSLADISVPTTRLDPDPTYMAGFTLTVVYELASAPVATVAVFDAAQWISTATPADIVFAVPGDVTLDVGWTAYEADRGITGDTLLLDGAALTPLRWDGSAGSAGNAADASAWGGAWANSLGIDAKPFAPVDVSAGAHTVTVTSTGDNYFLSTITVTVTPR